MSQAGCPGARFIRHPKPELFQCPDCNTDVEIWSDEFSAKCPSCGRIVVREGMMGCVEWCTMARECVGDAVYDSFTKMRAASIKERLCEVAAETATDAGDIRMMERALHYAEIIAQAEKADLHVAVAGTVLSVAFRGQPDIARSELLKIGFQLEDVDEVCGIVGDRVDSMNYAVVHDARLLAAKYETGRPSTENYLTATGSRLAG